MKTLLIAAAVAAFAAAANGQEGGLQYLAATNQAPGPTLVNSSLLYQSLPPEAMPRPLEKESIIQVLVDYRTVQLSEGSSESIKTGSFNSVLTDWIRFDGRNLFPATQGRGDPTVGGTVNSQLRAESEVEQRESLTFTIATKVVDIRPNGNLILEGTSEVKVNEEVWMIYVSGEAARQQIGPDLVVRHTALANPRIHKYEKGSVRDGAARGWLSRWYGKYKAF